MIESLYEENFAQGRLERTLNLPVTPVMDEKIVSQLTLIGESWKNHPKSSLKS